MNRGFIAGIGAANVDFHGESCAALVLRDSNPGHVRFSPGGVTRNILENLARLGERTELFSAVGDDFAGEYILHSCAAAGIGAEHVRRCEGAASSCYTALLDERGDMYVAMSDMRILEHIDPVWLEEKKDILLTAAAVVCDPCLSEAALDWISGGALKGIPLYADPVSTAYARRLRPYAGRFTCLKPNRMELAALTDCATDTDTELELAADALLRRGTEQVVVSLGERGCYWADRSGRRFYRSLPPVERMVDATGAGDAFMAGLIYGLQQGHVGESCVDRALAAGLVAVRSEGTVSGDMSAAVLKEILEGKYHESIS